MKKLIVLLIVLALTFSTLGCEIVEDTTNVTEFDSPHIYVEIDKETGVNYIVCYSDKGKGICPRYNADGTLYVSEVE